MAAMFSDCARTGEVLDAKEVFGKLALDAIATSGFGIESNSFRDPENVFRVNAMKLVRDPKYSKITDIPKAIFVYLAPKLAKSIGVNVIDPKVTEFFINIVKKTMENRKSTGTKRNDIIDLFMEEFAKERADDLLSKEDKLLGFVATAIVFFFAGFDTTSTTLGVIVHGKHVNDV